MVWTWILQVKTCSRFCHWSISVYWVWFPAQRCTCRRQWHLRLGVSSYTDNPRLDLRLCMVFVITRILTINYTVGQNVSVDANLGGTDNNALSIFGYNVTDLCAGTWILFRFCLNLIGLWCVLRFRQWKFWYYSWIRHQVREVGEVQVHSRLQRSWSVHHQAQPTEEWVVYSTSTPCDYFTTVSLMVTQFITTCMIRSTSPETESVCCIKSSVVLSTYISILVPRYIVLKTHL